MVFKCIVIGCRMSQSAFVAASAKKLQLSLHRLPKDLKLKTIWLEKLTLWNKAFPRQSTIFVCSSHFETGLVNTTFGLTRLAPKSVPTIQDCQKHTPNTIEESVIAYEDIEYLDSNDDENVIEYEDIEYLEKNDDENVCVEDLENQGLQDNCVAKKNDISLHIKRCVEDENMKLIKSSNGCGEVDQNYCSVGKWAPNTPIKRKDDTDQQEPKSKRTLRYPGDVNILECTPRTSKEGLKLCKSKIRQLQKKVSLLQAKHRRQVKLIKTLKALLHELKNKFSLSDNAMTSIEDNFTDEVLEQLRAGKKSRSYTENIRCFAMTLNFYSPRAYEYVRSKFGKHLPSQSCLRNWYKSIDGEPGILQEALDIVKAQVKMARSQGKKLYFAMMMDEMNIRKQILWSDTKKKYVGYVDYGHSQDTDNCQSEASNALVLLLNAVNGRFKIPVAYYLTATANADEQASIIHDLLIVLSENETEVISLTFDGARTNIKTAELLGADIWNPESLNCSLKHPSTGKPVQVFLDICYRRMTILKENDKK